MSDSSEEREKARGFRITRRRFLGYTWAVSAAVFLAQGLGAFLNNLRPIVKAGGFGGSFIAGSPEEFPVGSITYFREGRFYMSHVDSGFLALYRKCTHLGCVVPWRADQISEDDLAETGRFNCPCHSSIFDRYGGVRGGPAPRPLDIMPIELVEGKLVVNTSKIIQRGNFGRGEFDESQALKT